MARSCIRCLLPDAVPGADIDAEGVCAFCRDYRPTDAAASAAVLAQRSDDLERAIAGARGTGLYDALVCLSGGKDSLDLLYRATVTYKLRVLAFTVDANIPDVAWKSMRRTVEKLGVDHLVYRPPVEYYRKLFAYLLRNQEERGAVYTVSYVYAPLFEGDALTVATERNIPLVLAGYSPGQPEPERMEYEFSRRLIEDTDWTPPALRTAGIFTDAELARFWNPRRFPAGTRFPRYLAPFHAWDYDQEETMKRVTDLGLGRARVPRESHPQQLPGQLAAHVFRLEDVRLQPVCPGVFGANAKRQSQRQILEIHGTVRELHDPQQGAARHQHHAPDALAWSGAPGVAHYPTARRLRSAAHLASFPRPPNSNFPTDATFATDA